MKSSWCLGVGFVACFTFLLVGGQNRFFGRGSDRRNVVKKSTGSSLLPGGCLEIEERGGQGVARVDGEST